MANIEASQWDVPLFEVVEHIAGDLRQAVLQYEDLDHKGIGLPAEVDFGDEFGRAPVGNWESPLPVDGAIVEAWDRALKDLIGAVRLGKLKVKGRRPGSQFLEAISPGDFAEVADNPIADLESTVGHEGKRVLEFKDTKATIGKSHSTGTPEVSFTEVCAESGAEILTLWLAEPLAVPRPDLPNLTELLREAKDRKGAPLTQREAEKIGSDPGVKENQKEVRRVLERLQGKQDPGPRGPRTRRT
jgi:hypothetical protein